MSERKRRKSNNVEEKGIVEDPPSGTAAAAASTAASGSSPAAGAQTSDQPSQNGKRPMRESSMPSGEDHASSEAMAVAGKEDRAHQGDDTSDGTEDEEEDAMLKKQLTQTRNRKSAMKKVAETRAAHFARADANDRVRARPAAAGGAGGRSARSTTPLPVVHNKATGGGGGGPAGEPQEQWPGPFATARQMIRERPAAAAARQERLAGGQVLEEGAAGDEENDVEGINKFKIEWQPRAGKRPPPQHQVPSLGSLCLELLIKHMDDIESLGYVSTQVRYQFAEALAREGKLTSEAVTRLLIGPGLVEFYLPDCKHLDQQALIAALETVARFEEEEDDEAAAALPQDRHHHDDGYEKKGSSHDDGYEKKGSSSSEGGGGHGPYSCPLRILRLRWCGRGFGTQAADALVRLGVAQRLEALELSGLYHLTDAALEGLLSSCQSLTTLDLPYKSIVSGACLRAVAANTTITSLSIAHSPQVDLEAVQSLRALKRMRRLDLSGLSITDEVLEEVLKGNGATLTSLSLNSCERLTDKALSLISTHCKGLSRLDVGSVCGLSSEALLSFFSSATCARGLEEVVLSRLDPQVNDDVVVALAALCGQSLRHLDLSSCALDITDVSMAALAKFCHAGLTHVDLSFCRKVTDDGMGHLADSCPRLKSMALWGCTQVTDRFLHGHSRPGLQVVGRDNSNSSKKNSSSNNNKGRRPPPPPPPQRVS